ncbi:MAG: hypothetical protein LBB79_00770 [Prevotellaceae bacterium]|jgi:hypothetical protein|nr:hypothetical protein [Prevotellaceae bacterium]
MVFSVEIFSLLLYRNLYEILNLSIIKTKTVKKLMRIAVVCYAFVAFVRCASEEPKVSSVEQSNQVELEIFFAKLQTKDFSVLNELFSATTLSISTSLREEAKTKAKEAARTLMENPSVVDKASVLQGHKYLEKYIEIGADGRFTIGDKVDYLRIINDLTLSVEERKTEIAILYLTEFLKQVSTNTNIAKIKKTSSSIISPKAVNCSLSQYIDWVNGATGGLFYTSGVVGEDCEYVAVIVYVLNPVTINVEVTDNAVAEYANSLPYPLSLFVQTFHDAFNVTMYNILYDNCL